MKKTVYEQLLDRYLSLRNIYAAKETELRSEIAKTTRAINDNKSKLAEAVQNEDQATYIRVSSEQATLESELSYYGQVLNNLLEAKERDDAYDMDEVQDIMNTASSELNKLCADYNSKIKEMLQPIIDYTNEVKLQYALLRTVKKKTSDNLAKGRYGSVTIFDYSQLPVMGQFDGFLRRISDNPPLELDADIKAQVGQEVRKWI